VTVQQQQPEATCEGIFAHLPMSPAASLANTSDIDSRQSSVGRDFTTLALMSCDDARSLVRSTSENCISQRRPIDRRLHGSPEIIINYRSELQRQRGCC